ncbi:MAG: amidohydrolase [Phycisphaeraceae bacterium]|nr:amidohydrolase [Phycisphaeraceae bacterium]
MTESRSHPAIADAADHPGCGQVVACQLDTAWEDKPESHRRAESLLQTVSIGPGSLIVLPEMFATGFSLDVGTTSEASDGPSHGWLAALARHYAAYVVGGVVTLGDDGRGRNDAVVYGPGGSEIARYCKLHPFSYGKETERFEAGSRLASFQWGDLAVAPFVCYDLRFPEAFRCAVRRGAELLLVIANWPAARAQHWCTLLKARAIENQCYVVGVNRCGRDPNLDYAGRSAILDPRGEIITEVGARPCVLTAGIDPDALRAYREEFPALRDARPDLLPDDVDLQ